MTTEQHARYIANELETRVSILNGIINPHARIDAGLMARAATLIRELASNQLPDFDSIQPATPEPRAAEVVETWSKQAATLSGVSLSGAASRLSLAAAWIKARDQEIAALRTALSRVQEPPQAFERASPESLGPWPFGKLGEYKDARAPKTDAPASDLQSQLAPLLALFEQQSRAQSAHWLAMEHQIRRVADAVAVRALRLEYDLNTDEGEALLSRVRAELRR